MRFEWDPNKERTNQNTHGLSFEEAKELFTSNVDFLEIYDEEHSEHEQRFIAIGPVRTGVIVVTYTEREGDVVRIITARKATKSEAILFRNYFGVADE